MSTQLRSVFGSSVTLRERIVDAIRTSIIKGDLRPGERVSEPALAEHFGISRTPIREALRQLGSEGFLTVIPRRGARVSVITEKDVREFYDLRALLEGYAARLATPLISQSDLDKMLVYNEEMEKFHHSGDLQNNLRVHRAFHDTINKASANEQLRSLISILGNKFQRFSIHIALSGKNQEAFVQHRNIVQAMRAGDADAAEALVRANALLGKELMIKEVNAES